MVTDVLGEDGSPITQEKLVELKDRIVYQAFDERSAANQVTGEWIVYLPHEGKNFYLCLVSCPINSMAFAVGHLADFQGANDEHI